MKAETKIVTKQIVKEINDQCPPDQGIFVQPYGVPVHIKGLLIYTRYTIGGMNGGSCWDTTAKPFLSDPPKNKWRVLELLLEKICPKITFLQYKRIDDLIHTNKETQHEYYGNSKEEMIEYIIVSELEELLLDIGAIAENKD